MMLCCNSNSNRPQSGLTGATDHDWSFNDATASSRDKPTQELSSARHETVVPSKGPRQQPKGAHTIRHTSHVSLPYQQPLRKRLKNWDQNLDKTTQELRPTSKTKTKAVPSKGSQQAQDFAIYGTPAVRTCSNQLHQVATTLKVIPTGWYHG